MCLHAHRYLLIIHFEIVCYYLIFIKTFHPQPHFKILTFPNL